MNFENLWKRKLTLQDRKWLVRVRDVKGLDLYFKTRKEAREYKNLLKRSNRMLEAEIICREWLDEFLLEDRVVS